MSNVFGYLAVGLIRLLGLLSHKGAQRLGGFIGWVLWRRLTRAKAVARVNVAKCFPDWSEEKREALVKASLINNGMTMAEAGAVWGWPESKGSQLLAGIEGEDALTNAQGVKTHVVAPDDDIYSADLDEHLAAMNRGVEACVLKCPEQYLWSFKRSRRQPDGGKVYQRAVNAWRMGACGLLLLALSGCAQQSVVVAPEPAAKPQAANDQLVTRLLAQAERALAAGRLMTPSSDNAYDRYRAVLLLAPGNPDATSGIQLILIRYLELGRNALARSQLDEAAGYLTKAQALPVESELPAELGAQIKARRAELNRIQAEALAADLSKVWLIPAELTAKSPILQQQLLAVAQRIAKTRESLLIVARNDAEGRWLYKQIKRDLSGYRLRGDIHVGPQAYLQFQPTLD